MPKFGQKKQLTDYLYTRPAIFLLVIILVWLSISVYERFAIEREMAERRAEVEAEQGELLERKEFIEEQVDYLEGERGIEEELRKRFDVAKEGEQVVILLGEDEVTKAEIEVEPERSKRWYEFWLKP